VPIVADAQSSADFAPSFERLSLAYFAPAIEAFMDCAPFCNPGGGFLCFTFDVDVSELDWRQAYLGIGI
jgi:hypothetical protein